MLDNNRYSIFYQDTGLKLYIKGSYASIDFWMGPWYVQGLQVFFQSVQKCKKII